MGPSDSSPNIQVIVRVCPHHGKNRGEGRLKESPPLVNIISDGDRIPSKLTVNPYQSVGQSKGVATAFSPTCRNNDSSANKFTFDAIHGPQSTQMEVYDSVKNIVEDVIEGYVFLLISLPFSLIYQLNFHAQHYLSCSKFSFFAGTMQQFLRMGEILVSYFFGLGIFLIDSY